MKRLRLRPVAPRLGHRGLPRRGTATTSSASIRDPAVVDGLATGRPPLFEPGLDELLRPGLAAGRLRVHRPTCAARCATPTSSGSPSTHRWTRTIAPTWTCVVRRVERLLPASRATARVVLISSQVPVGTTRAARATFAARRRRPSRRVRLLAREPAPGQGHRGLPQADASWSARARPRRARALERAARAARPTDRVDVGRVGGDDQARAQRVPGHLGGVHQRDRRRSARRSAPTPRRSSAGSRARRASARAPTSAPGARLRRRDAGARRRASCWASGARLGFATPLLAGVKQSNDVHRGWAAPAAGRAARPARRQDDRGPGASPTSRAPTRCGAPSRSRSAAGCVEQGATVRAHDPADPRAAAGARRALIAVRRRARRARSATPTRRRRHRVARVPRAHGRRASPPRCARAAGPGRRPVPGRRLGGDAARSATSPSGAADSRSDDVKLEGRTILITGASQGLGLAIAERCRRPKARASPSARATPRGHRGGARGAARARPATERSAWSPPSPTCRMPEQVEALVADARRASSAASTSWSTTPASTAPRDRSRRSTGRSGCEAIEINLSGTVLPCRAVAPALPAARLRQDRQPVGRRRDRAAAAAQRLRRVEGGGRALHRDAGRGGARHRDRRQRHRARRAQHAPARRGARRRARTRSARPSTSARSSRRRRAARRSRRAPRSARSCSRAASDGITGRLLSAVWDPWRDLPARRDELAESDIYTLRRIVPRTAAATGASRERERRNRRLRAHRAQAAAVARPGDAVVALRRSGRARARRPWPPGAAARRRSPTGARPSRGPTSTP